MISLRALCSFSKRNRLLGEALSAAGDGDSARREHVVKELLNRYQDTGTLAAVEQIVSAHQGTDMERIEFAFQVASTAKIVGDGLTYVSHADRARVLKTAERLDIFAGEILKIAAASLKRQWVYNAKDAKLILHNTRNDITLHPVVVKAASKHLRLPVPADAMMRRAQMIFQVVVIDAKKRDRLISAVFDGCSIENERSNLIDYVRSNPHDALVLPKVEDAAWSAALANDEFPIGCRRVAFNTVCRLGEDIAFALRDMDDKNKGRLPLKSLQNRLGYIYTAMIPQIAADWARQGQKLEPCLGIIEKQAIRAGFGMPPITEALKDARRRMLQAEVASIFIFRTG